MQNRAAGLARKRSIKMALPHDSQAPYELPPIFSSARLTSRRRVSKVSSVSRSVSYSSTSSAFSSASSRSLIPHLRIARVPVESVLWVAFPKTRKAFFQPLLFAFERLAEFRYFCLVRHIGCCIISHSRARGNFAGENQLAS